MKKSVGAQAGVLRIECGDQKGIIHKVTGVLFRKGLNIVQNDEFVDSETCRFFMRTEYSGRSPDSALLRSLKAVLPRDARVDLVPRRRKAVAVLATREHHCLGELLIRNAYGELGADIRAIVSNHLFLKDLAARFKIPYHHVPHERMTREKHEAKLLAILRRLRPDYVVLAKYMRILSPAFTSRYENRIINIHHSFLPAFEGAHPYEQAYERGVKIIGATAHFVNEDLDKGPIIAQGVVPVDHSHDAADMAQAGRDVEKLVLAKALALAFEDRIFVSGNRTVIFD